MNEDPDKLIGEVGHRLAELRQELGMTLTELAQKLGVTYQSLQRIERGEQNLTLRTMAKLAKALDVRTVDLFEPPGSGHPRKRKAARS